MLVPGVVSDLRWLATDHLRWSTLPCALRYNVYRGIHPLTDSDGDGVADHYGFCFELDLLAPEMINIFQEPGPGGLHTFLVTGENDVGEGSLGFTSGLLPRPNLDPCP